MPILSRAAFLAFMLSFCMAARAVPIDDFVLTGNGHTFSYSLPATSSFPDFSLFNFFSESAPTTIDGVSGYTTSGAYYDTYFYPFVSLVLYVPPAISATGSIPLLGPTFINFAFVPAVNPPPYYQVDVVPTFIPGTYTFHDITTGSSSGTRSLPTP